MNNDQDEILYNLLNNGYEVNYICNYLKSNKNFKQWNNYGYFRQSELEIKKEYDYNLMWTNEYGTFIHKYLLLDFGKYLNKNISWKLMDLIVNHCDEDVNRIREAYQISEYNYTKIFGYN